MFQKTSWLKVTVVMALCAMGLGSNSYSSVVASGSEIVRLSSARPDLTSQRLNAPSGWYIEKVESNVLGMGESSLVLDSAGRPHIAFEQQSTGLMYGVREDSGWEFQEVGVIYASTPSLALDAADGERPYIAYNGSNYGQNSFNLGLTWFNGDEWQYIPIDISANSGSSPSLVVSGGEYHISYIHEDNSLTRFLYYAHSNTSFPPAPAPIDNLGNLSLANGNSVSSLVITNGYLSVSYVGDGVHLNYASLSSGSWITRTIDSSPEVGGFSSLAVPSGGIARVSYFDRTNYDLKYAYKKLVFPYTWQTEIVDGATSRVGFYTSLAVDSAGVPHISYCEVDQGDLKYATRLAGGTWQVETLDSNGKCSSTSLSVDQSGKVHILYYDYDTRDLRYAVHFPFQVDLPLILR